MVLYRDVIIGDWTIQCCNIVLVLFCWFCNRDRLNFENRLQIKLGTGTLLIETKTRCNLKIITLAVSVLSIGCITHV